MLDSTTNDIKHLMKLLTKFNLKFCHLDFKSLSFSEYLLDFAHFGVILFVEMSFITF